MQDKNSSLGLIEQPETETQNLSLQMRFGSDESCCVVREDTGEISLEIAAPVLAGAGRELVGSSPGGTIRTVGAWSIGVLQLFRFPVKTVRLRCRLYIWICSEC